MNFKSKLQSLRKEKGFSQEAMAEKIGVTRQAVAKWELGQTTPDIDNLIALSNLFGVSIDRLVKSDPTCMDKIENQQIDCYDEIIEFLCKACKATYAGNGAKSESSRPKSKDYLYEDGKYKYLDTYLGGEKFIGEEAIWVSDIPVWSMNYIGRLLEEDQSYDFLTEALSHSTKEMPYRGPAIYINGDYIYHCSVQGTFEWFQGHEEIFFKHKKIYECYFHGGCIK
jgi:transcriptional regulator with XRE-family HTH domain